MKPPIRTTVLSWLLIIAMAPAAQAQYEGAEEGFALRFLAPNFVFPLDQQLSYDDFTGGIELEYVRHLNGFLNLAVPMKLANTQVPVEEDGTDLSRQAYAGLDVLGQLKFFRQGQFLNPALYTGLGAHVQDFDQGVLSLPLGINIDVRLAPGFYLSTKGEYRLSNRDLRDNLQWAIGFKGLVGDFAKDQPEPEPMISDRDRDRVPDEVDDCPDVAGLIGLSGCPDADQDGVADQEDDCPLLAGSPNLRGCPDTDGDGLIDPQDDCPEQAGPAGNRGCPVQDADQDGVPDAEDRCPTSPGTAANAGCPEIEADDQQVLDLAMQAVNFETGSATLTAGSLGILDQIVAILRRYPDYYMAIGGHTDSVGSATSNQDLSERRAKACYDYLVSQGIDAARLTYQGYGESEPIADNRYRDGREENRRVEFDIYLPDAGNKR